MSDLNLELLLSQARAAIDLQLHPGYAQFTRGTVRAVIGPGGTVELVTDNRWAASAIRARLHGLGHAVTGDPDNTSCAVTVWPVAAGNVTPLPRLAFTDDVPGRTFWITGPDGAVEQQCGAGGHSDTVVHASHPFPAAVWGPCTRHGLCWSRSTWSGQWRQFAAPRRHVYVAVDRDGSRWVCPPVAVGRMRSMYRMYVHGTRGHVQGVDLGRNVASGPDL